MSNVNLQTKKSSPTDLIEERSRGILRSKLPLEEAAIQHMRDKNPIYDGIIDFFDNNGFVTRLFFQLKSTEADVSFHDTKTDFLNYCHKAPEPNFLILVNISEDKVYWEHIDKAYIENVLGIKDLKKFDQKTKRVKFSEINVVEQNSPTLIEVCKKHYADNAKYFVVPTTETSIKTILGEGELKPFEEVKKKFVEEPAQTAVEPENSENVSPEASASASPSAPVETGETADVAPEAPVDPEVDPIEKIVHDRGLRIVTISLGAEPIEVLALQPEK